MRRSEARLAPVANFWWQPGPPPPVQIPITWMSQPLQWRLESPLNKALVTGATGSTALSVNQASFEEYKAYPFRADLETASDADAANLAHFVTTYHPDARMCLVSVTVDLMYLTDTQRRRLLGIGLGRRIQPTGIPPEWPADATTLLVTGIRHTITPKKRLITFTTGPVIEQTWFRYGVSSYGGTDIRLW